MSNPSDKNKQTGAVLWIVLALIILIVFLIKQDTIIRVLKETDFFIHVFGEEPAFIANYEMPMEQDADESIIILTEEPLTTIRDISTNESQSAQIIDEFIANEDEVDAIEQIPSSGDDTIPITDTLTETTLPNDIQESPAEKTLPPPIVVQPIAKMNQHLYFIFINGDGTVERKEIIREVSKNTTPLTTAIQALLGGPGLPELEKGYISLIPEGTQLLSATVKDKTATINFSEDFAFNQYGVEGYLGQLMQIVYTATSFSTIDKVQFLIDGQKSEYLGGEGVWIGTPLGRLNFK